MKTETINQSMSFDKYAYSWSQPASTHYQCNFPSPLSTEIKEKERVQTIKRFDLFVENPGQTIIKCFKLERSIKIIKGVLITSDKDDLLYYRGSSKINIDGDNYFPEGYESKLLMSGINILPRLRYFELDCAIKNNFNLEMEYSDSDYLSKIFEPYRVSVYLKCEI